MRHLGVTIFACTVTLLAGVTANAQDDQRLITVNGHAEIRVVPDEVIVSLGVETFDVDLEAAKQLNDSRVSAVVAAAKANGVSEAHINTEYVRIEPEYRTENWEPQFLHYRIRKTLVITLREIDRFETLLSGVLEAGADYVHGVDFRTTELRLHRDRARALAIVAAREKATALANELGESIGRVHSIQEGHAGWWSWYGSGWGRGPGGALSQNVVQNAGGPSAGLEGPTTPGQIAIDARVTVTFDLAE